VSVPTLLVVLPLEGRASVRVEGARRAHDRLADWAISSGELLRLAQLLVDLHVALTEAEEDAER
jgi:hypothetical protein